MVYEPYHALQIWYNCTRLFKIKNKLKSVVFTNNVGKNSRYFVCVFNKTVIPLALVGYEMLRALLAIFISLGGGRAKDLRSHEGSGENDG